MFTLLYNPTLLNITAVAPSAALTNIAGASFTLFSNTVSGTSGTLMLSLSSPTSLSTASTAFTLGSLLATVPLSATATYGAKQLMHFSGEQLRGTAGPITVAGVDGVQVASYFGDVNDAGGPLNLQDATAISVVGSGVPNTAAQTIPGFTAFPTLDPILIGDVSLQGIVNQTDAGAITQQVGGTSQPTIPYAPIGLPVTPVGPSALASMAATPMRPTLVPHSATRFIGAWEQIGQIGLIGQMNYWQALLANPAIAGTAPRASLSVPAPLGGAHVDWLTVNYLASLSQRLEGDLAWYDDDEQALPLWAKRR